MVENRSRGVRLVQLRQDEAWGAALPPEFLHLQQVLESFVAEACRVLEPRDRQLLELSRLRAQAQEYEEQAQWLLDTVGIRPTCQRWTNQARILAWGDLQVRAQQRLSPELSPADHG
jgi:hypothetical protein